MKNINQIIKEVLEGDSIRKIILNESKSDYYKEDFPLSHHELDDAWLSDSVFHIDNKDYNVSAYLPRGGNMFHLRPIDADINYDFDDPRTIKLSPRSNSNGNEMWHLPKEIK